MKKNADKYLGFIGFLGFTGFRYFMTGNAADLCGFAFFAFFAYFWIAKLHVSIPDERYFENVQRAKAFAADLAVLVLVVLFITSVFFSQIRELLVFGIAIAYAAVIIAYAAKLYQLEEK